MKDIHVNINARSNCAYNDGRRYVAQAYDGSLWLDTRMETSGKTLEQCVSEAERFIKDDSRWMSGNRQMRIVTCRTSRLR